MGEVLWAPSAEQRAASTMARFAAFAGAPGEYGALQRWSIADLGRFWRALARFYAIELAGDPVAGTSLSFPDAELSYVAQVFRERPAEQTALIAAGEDVPDRALSWGELERQVAAAAAGLAAAGVEAGDRVVGYLPNVPEAVIAFLATASLGAIWSCCSPDFGAQAVIDRFAQIEPKVLIAVERYRYGGREHDRSASLAAIRRALPTVTRTVLDWDAFVAPHRGARLRPRRVPFSHPLWILYSSGTTGVPKALVHTHGGIVLEHLKWLGLHFDARPGERIFWHTTTAWTMWNGLVGALLVGAVPVLYDGSPAYPDLNALYDLAERAEVGCFGAGASVHAATMKAGVLPRGAGRALARLRSVGSTGSPLAPEVFDWIYERLGPDLWLFSCSGGTDVCTAFVGGTPLLPVRRGELQAAALGVDVQAWDPDGRPLPAGEVGELVVTQPLPSMPAFLWGDADGSRLRDAYFATYPGVWRHGDWIEFTPARGAIIHGRSDATINRAGVRIGTAEVYRAVLALPEVADAVVVDVPRAGGESWMPLFVALEDDAVLDATLADAIRARIREACSPRHVPDEVIQAPGIPRTLTGKVLEVPVKRLLMGEPAETVASRDSLADPAAFDWFAAYARLNAR